MCYMSIGESSIDTKECVTGDRSLGTRALEVPTDMLIYRAPRHKRVYIAEEAHNIVRKIHSTGRLMTSHRSAPWVGA
jgi:hypothetical protein